MKAQHRHSFILSVIILLISVNLSSLSFAIDGEYSHAVFSGLKSVYVQVDPINPKTEQKGIASAQLRKDTEQQLKKAGIKVLSEEEYNRLKISATYPLARLDLSVTIDEIQIENVSFNVNNIVVGVRQAAFLGRKPAISMFATTWERREIDFSDSSAAIQQKVRAYVGEFIAAYLAANPR